MGQRHAGRKDERIDIRVRSAVTRSASLRPSARSLLAAGTMIVPDDDIGTAGGERLRAHKAGGSKTEDGDTSCRRKR